MSEEIQQYKLSGPTGKVELTYFLPGSGSIVSLLPPDAGSKYTPEGFSDVSTADFQYWGESNDQPREWRLKAEKSTTAYPLIAKSVGIIYGRGLTYWKETVNQNGSITRDFTRNQEIDKFLRNNFCFFLMQQRAMDLFLPGNIWCEFILNKGMTKIVGLNHLEAEFTRFGKIRDDKSGFDFIRYTGDWTKPNQAVAIPFLNRQEFDPETIKKDYKAWKKFAWHSYLPSPGRTIYAFPPHGGVYRKNGWLDFANSIPELMNAINQNAATIKYHIEIPYKYWQYTYENWDNLDPQKQKELINAKMTEMNNFLTGVGNNSKNFYSHYDVDPMTGKNTNNWKITAVGDNSKKDAFLTSMQEADQQIARAYNVDSSLSNIQKEGGKMGAGSGSDKRVGMENQVNTSYMYSDIITEPLSLVAWYNNWGDNLKFGFIHDIPTSLNEDKSGSKTDLN